MVTDDERREVAARLRKHIGKPLFTGQDVEDIIGVQRSDFDAVLADASYRRLADLIEPGPQCPYYSDERHWCSIHDIETERTCRVVTDKNAVSQTQEIHTKYCSECSYVFGREQHRQLLPGLDEEFVLHAVQIPNYCPNCGAKVVAE